MQNDQETETENSARSIHTTGRQQTDWDGPSESWCLLNLHGKIIHTKLTTTPNWQWTTTKNHEKTKKDKKVALKEAKMKLEPKKTPGFDLTIGMILKKLPIKGHQMIY